MMNKYVLYRSFGSLDKKVRKHELVAVEYGKDIDGVADALMYTAKMDASELEQYQKHYSAAACVPEEIDIGIYKVKRYACVMDVILYPDFGDKNDVIEYGIVETKESGRAA